MPWSNSQPFTQMPTLPIFASHSYSSRQALFRDTPLRKSSSTLMLFTRSIQMNSMLFALFIRQSSSSLLILSVFFFSFTLSSLRVASSCLMESRDRSQEYEVKGCRMFENLLKTLVKMGDEGLVVSCMSKSLTRCRYSCSESSSMVKQSFKNRLRTELTSLSSLSRPSSSRDLSLLSSPFTPFLIINQISTIISTLLQYYNRSAIAYSSKITFVLPLLLLRCPVVVVVILAALVVLSLGAVVSVVTVVTVVAVIVVAFGFVLVSLLVLGLVLLLGLGLGLADGVPEFLLLVLLGF